MGRGQSHGYVRAVSVLSVGRQSRPHMFAAAGSRVFCIADNVVLFGFPRALCLLVSLPFFSVLWRKRFQPGGE